MASRQTHILSPEEEVRARMGLPAVAECGTAEVWHNWTPLHTYATCQRCRKAMQLEESPR